jgi:protein phosphatase
VVPAAEIATLLGTGDPTYAAGALVEKALENGAPDNVTVVVAQVVDVDAADAAALLTAQPVVVGAAGERRNREQLADLAFPDDAEPDPTAGAAGVAASGEGAGVGCAASRRTRGGWIKPTLVVAVVVLALASITTGAVLWAHSQYYVGVADGNVAIYQGLNASVLGRPLATPVAVSTIAVTSLPEYAQEQVVNAMPANGFEGAQQVTAALACLTVPTSSGCTTSPSPTPTPTGTTATPLLSPPTTTPGPSAPGSSP